MKYSNIFPVVTALTLAVGCTYTPNRRYATTPPPTYTYTPVPPSAPVYQSAYPVGRGTARTPVISDSDRDLVTSVRHQFSRYGDLSGLAPNIQVTALNGTVTLSGSVPSERDREMIDAMVRNTAGVVDLRNELQIAGPGTTASRILTPSDRALAAEVRQVLENQPTVSDSARNIQINARSGTVTLKGRVSTPEDRQLITSLVRNTPGVVAVVDQLQVPLQPTARIDNNRVHSLSTGDVFQLRMDGLTESDRALAQQISESLRSDPSLEPLLPVVNVNIADGKVTLQGTVQTERQKQNIVSAVRRVAGSNNVLDLLRVESR